MRILIDHGAARNLGDTGMVEAVVLQLRNLLPHAELYVIARSPLRMPIWDLPQVFRQAPYAVRPFWSLSLSKVPYFWRFERSWRRTISGLFLGCLGRLRTAGSLALPAQKENGSQTKTLAEFCEPFDALHVVGGGNLTDEFYEELYRRCCLILAFAEQRKPVTLTGQQLGPFTSTFSKRGLARALRRASFVGLRERSDSWKFCEESHLDPARFEVMGDDSLALPPAEESLVCSRLAEHGLRPKEFLAINLRVGYYAAEHARHLEKVATLADRLGHQFGLPVLFVPLALNELDSDIVTAKKVVQAMRFKPAVVMEEEGLTPALVKGVMGQAFGAVGVSYHFCTFALSQGVPAVCIHDGDYYSQKARGLSAFWQDERLALSLRNVGAHAAADQIRRTLEDSSLRDKLALLSRQALKCWHAVFERQMDALGRLGC